MDNNKIFEKTKMKIAISNVKEEDIVMDKRKLNIGKGIGIAACITLSMTGVVFATTQIINKFGANSSDGIQTAIENGYYSDINTEYKEANGISTSIEAFLIDNDNFDINFNIKFDDSYSLQDMLANDGKIDIMDLKVVNEKNEKVFATRELETEEMTSLYKTEQEARDNYTSYNGSYSETTQKINDNEIEKTITEQIYADLVPVEQTLKDITIVDYFPQYIIDNFEMAYVEGMDALKISSEIDKETNSITWTIPELKAEKTLKVQYTLTLKDEFNEKIIDQILDTNQKVEINYKDFDNTEKTTESTVTPKLKLTAIKAEEPKTEPTITEPTKDETKAPEELPKTGAPILFGFITVATVSTIAFAVKSKKFNF